MIEILSQYGRAFLYWDGSGFSGLAVTLWLLVASLLIGFVMAVPLAVARVSRNRWVSTPVRCYTYVFRGTPLFVQLLLIYSGLYSLEFVRSHELLDTFFRSGLRCAILAFGLNTGAYTTEIFAGAIRSISHGEVEAARAYGMGGLTLYRRVILPSALRRALPLYSNEVILMLHATTVAFTATVPDVLKVARDANSATYMSFQAFGLAALIYLAVSFALVAVFRRAEQRWLAYLAVGRH
ncbi:ABC transporter permease [Trinickia fusca]|uniref:Histidine/lysine/arginine/ornithine transport system permease protein HisM n=1 Tax=Trinickia fusca TaxID=2419777 RepID=A0A494XVP9_9BURK|nr:ABC transporter permease [Trinickia fusca]RKP52139.1 histidine ABC transporter permease HisM [Trinickia fusca]